MTISPFCKQTLERHPIWLRLISAEEVYDFLSAPYFKNGKLLQSSRTMPLPPHPWKIGTWRKHNEWGIYGHDLECLLEIPIAQIKLSEGDYTRCNTEGRGDDAERYSTWLRQGRIAPPITVIEMPDFTLKLSDGHRRTAAAKLTDRTTIQAWVSFAMPTGKIDCNGKTIYTSLTHEGVLTGAEAARAEWEKQQSLLKKQVGISLANL